MLHYVHLLVAAFVCLLVRAEQVVFSEIFDLLLPLQLRTAAAEQLNNDVYSCFHNLWTFRWVVFFSSFFFFQPIILCGLCSPPSTRRASTCSVFALDPHSSHIFNLLVLWQWNLFTVLYSVHVKCLSVQGGVSFLCGSPWGSFHLFLSC